MLRIQSDDNMDEPINVQGTARDMLDEPMAALFQHQWQLYRKFVDNNYFYWSFHNLRDIYLFTMKMMFYILWYAPGWEDVTTQYIGGDALSCYRSVPSGERCRGDREAAGFTLGQCITLAHKMAAGWTEGS